MWKLGAPLRFGHALVPGKIAPRAYVTEAAHHKLTRDFVRLRCTVFEEEPAAARQILRGCTDDMAQISQGIIAGRQRDTGLVTHSCGP